MRGDFLISILNVLKDGAGDFEDMILAYLSAGYGASLSKLEYEQRKLREERLGRIQERARESELRKKCSRMIYYLKQHNLISEDKGIFSITRKGKRKLDELWEDKLKSLPSVNYRREKTPELVLISFDVPEKERNKRAWLREVLKYLDFQMIHKSVWLGGFKIPKEFIEDLKRTKLVDFVEVLSVNRKGILEKVV